VTMHDNIADEVSRAQQRREANGDAVHGNTTPRIAKSPIGVAIRESLGRRYEMPNIKGDRPPDPLADVE
jgi:hypothetical protein